MPVKFCLTRDTELAIDFVLDTGFNSYLTLPQQAVEAMGMALYGSMEARLADGSLTIVPVYIAEINWDDRKISVPVLATGSKPLLGTALLQDFCLTVEFIAQGVVRLERL